MNTEHPDWDTFYTRFQSLIEHATRVDKAPPLDRCRLYLCLYGENGLSPEEEFSFLDLLAQAGKDGLLKRVEIETSYWQDVVLFIP
ncbi:MAG: hypothetical protein K2X01_06880 [Cyanobacteria bacterium]|nr:hypothetical protein [Cyanobacteriota bacterium]